MGCNFYVDKDGEQLHIGKSSVGWCFALQVLPEKGIETLEDWQAVLDDQDVIKDEYGTQVSVSELLDRITNRSSDEPVAATGPHPMRDRSWPWYKTWEEFHGRNHSEPGPNNLLRHKKDGVHCVGHGEGTYDYIAGEFS